MSGILGGIAGNLAGGNIGRAVVSLVLETTGYNAQLEKTKTETIAATDSTAASTSKFSQYATAAYAVAGVAALDFAKSSVAAAEEHAQVLAALTTQVGGNTQAFQDQATALQNVSGFQDEAILSADTILSRYKLTQDQVRATIPSLLDLARVQGITVPDAATQFGKAVLGNTRALKALGISSSEFVVTGNRAADAAKLVGLLNDKIGGQAAAYAQTLSGKMEILSAKFNDLEEAVGGPLVTDLTNLADQISIVGDAVGKLGDVLPGGTTGVNLLHDALMPLSVVAEYNTKVLGFLGKAIGVSTDSTEGLTQATGDLTAAGIPAATAIGDLSQTQKQLTANTTAASAAALKHAQALRTEREALLSEAGGFTGLIASMDTVKTDQEALKKLADQGKQGTAAYAAQVRQTTIDQLSFRDSLRQVADQLQQSGDGIGKIKSVLREMAAQAGISGKAFKNAFHDAFSSAGADITNLNNKLNEINNQQVTLHVNTAQLAIASKQASNLANQLSRGL